MFIFSIKPKIETVKVKDYLAQKSKLKGDRFVENLLFYKVTYLIICYSFFFLQISKSIATQVIVNFTELFPIINSAT